MVQLVCIQALALPLPVVTSHSCYGAEEEYDWHEGPGGGGGGGAVGRQGLGGNGSHWLHADSVVSLSAKSTTITAIPARQ